MERQNEANPNVLNIRERVGISYRKKLAKLLREQSKYLDNDRVEEEETLRDFIFVSE